jgi:hypothetical protein
MANDWLTFLGKVHKDNKEKHGDSYSYKQSMMDAKGLWKGKKGSSSSESKPKAKKSKKGKNQKGGQMEEDDDDVSDSNEPISGGSNMAASPKPADGMMAIKKGGSRRSRKMGKSRKTRRTRRRSKSRSRK